MAVACDLLLRFSWTLTLIPVGEGPFGSPSFQFYLIPVITAAEICRRCMWSFFRIGARFALACWEIFSLLRLVRMGAPFEYTRVPPCWPSSAAFWRHSEKERVKQTSQSEFCYFGSTFTYIRSWRDFFDRHIDGLSQSAVAVALVYCIQRNQVEGVNSVIVEINKWEKDTNNNTL